MKHENKRQKRRHVWKANHLRKHRFSFKGIRWKREWYWCREKYCLEDHEQRRALEKIALQKVVIEGDPEDNVYFPSKWKNGRDYID